MWHFQESLFQAWFEREILLLLCKYSQISCQIDRKIQISESLKLPKMSFFAKFDISAYQIWLKLIFSPFQTSKIHHLTFDAFEVWHFQESLCQDFIFVKFWNDLKEFLCEIIRKSWFEGKIDMKFVKICSCSSQTCDQNLEKLMNHTPIFHKLCEMNSESWEITLLFFTNLCYEFRKADLAEKFKVQSPWNCQKCHFWQL